MPGEIAQEDKKKYEDDNNDGESGSVLRIRNLRLWFNTEEGTVRALNGIDLDIPRGKILGIVGESGCGKSVCALSMMGLVPTPPGRFGSESQILFRGRNILSCKESELELIRGTGIAIIFQEPMSSLNPVFKIGDQIGESIRVRILRSELNKKRSISLKESLVGVKGIDEKRVRREVVQTLEKVRIPDAAQMQSRYPHELSGGMRQRVMIAMALASRPSLLIADEPTTSLDVSTQAQILALIKDLVKEFDMSVAFISHDLSVVAEISDEIAVMYAGNIVEQADSASLFLEPKHPYTQGLIKAQPKLGDKRKELESLKGSVPSLIRIPSGCAFHPRCASRFAPCDKLVPALLPLAQEGSNKDGRRRMVACHLYTAGDKISVKVGEGAA